MMSTTLKYYPENSNSKPNFHINGKPIIYTAQSKYLGYLITSSLSDSAHVREIFSKFSRTIAIFKASVKVSKKCLLLRFARTYLLPCLHNLEFVNKITSSQRQRFKFCLRKIFNLRSDEELEKFRKGIRWLYFDNILHDAHERYKQIET